MLNFGKVAANRARERVQSSIMVPEDPPARFRPQSGRDRSEAGFANNTICLLGFDSGLKRKLMNEHSLQRVDRTKILRRYLTLRNGQIEFGLYTEH